MKTLAILLGASFMACANSNTSNKPVTEWSKPAPSAGSSHIAVNQAISKECGMTASRAQFEFDSAAISTKDENLDVLANCLTAGKLKDRNVRIVGYTDARGTEEYNKDLGKSRAESVASYLEGRGVKSNKIIKASRGKEYAVGKDAEGYAFDRRVEIDLAD